MNYRVEIYRLGKENKLISRSVNLPRFTQDYLCYSYSWGCKWKNNFSYKLPDNSTSGMYSAKLIDNAGRYFWVTFIVKPPIGSSGDILLLASTNTWQAYNNWGGGSFYSNRVNSDVPSSSNVSFLRPNPQANPEQNKAGMHLADAELFMHQWLEKNNYNYHSYADIDIHNDQSILSKYKLLIIHAHPEYWSQRMLEYLKEYLDYGGSLMYLGGNGLYWKVVINTDLNILEVRKKGDLHYFNASTGGLWKNLGFPQSTILGVSYTSYGIGTYHPFEVYNEDHWILENTGLKNGDTFSSECFNCAGGSGHETDKIDIYSPEVDTIAVGTNPNNGGAHMIYYKRSNGGQVFSASSISFTGTLQQDEKSSMIVKNVINRFIK